MNRIINNSKLPFDFSHNVYASYMEKFIHFFISIKVVYVYHDNNKNEMCDYNTLQKLYRENKFHINNIKNISLIVNIFDNIPALEKINAIAHKAGYYNYINNLFNDIYEDVIELVEKDLNRFYDYESIDDLFYLDEFEVVNFNSIIEANNKMNNRINIFFDMLNKHIYEIKDIAEYYYEDLYMTSMRGLSAIFREADKSMKIKDDSGKVLGEITENNFGITYYFKSGKDFNKWINKKED